MIIKKWHSGSFEKYNSLVLAMDIGGTNTKMGILNVKKNKLKIIKLSCLKTSQIRDLGQTINKFIASNPIGKIKSACLAVAGIVSEKSAVMTNSTLRIDKRRIIKKTGIKNIRLVNDFEALGYAINILSKKDIKIIKKGAAAKKAPVVVIGAGTGLGKSTVIYDRNLGFYRPLPSEAGHMDFAAESRDELELADFVKTGGNAYYEQLLSGNGLVNIYLFLKDKNKGTKYTKEIEKSLKPELISKYRKKDKTCRLAFDTFKRIYARFAKNCALDSLAYSGIYIAGGIAKKNQDIFDKEFARVFEGSHKFRYFLSKMPIYLIINENAGLLGAGFAASLKDKI